MPFGNIQFTTLAIRGAPDTHNWRGLVIAGPTVASGNTPLMMAAPPSQAAPLSIGHTFHGSGDVDLVINGSLAPGIVGASGQQSYATLAIARSVENDQTSTFSLFLDAPTIGSVINTTTLTIPVTTIPNHDNSSTIFVSGASTSAPGADNNNIGLVVRSPANDNTNATLYINKDFNFSDNIPLQIRSGNSSGNMPLATSGTFYQDANIPLLIRTPLTTNQSLFTQGYLE
jgi:hypothetical protein